MWPNQPSAATVVCKWLLPCAIELTSVFLLKESKYLKSLKICINKKIMWPAYTHTSDHVSQYFNVPFVTVFDGTFVLHGLRYGHGRTWTLPWSALRWF